MKGLFIPGITEEMFRNGCLESIETLMAEGEIYDIEYSKWIPVKFRPLTDEEQEEYPDYCYMADCQMPDDGVIKESTQIDYRKYNEIAKSFLNTYGLSSVTSQLTVSMKTDVNGSAEGLGCNSNMSYTSSFTIPLTKRTANISITETAPGNETKVFVCNEAIASRAILGYSAISGIALSAVLAIILIFFIFLTRNHDINYSIKVQRILNAYKSYIQKLKGEFDTSGYQILEIDTFPEMLGIRDTIQSPILMSENLDETRTVFLIPTATKLLYIFEIKVDNYDQIYNSIAEDTETTMQEEGYTPVPVSEECANREEADATASSDITNELIENEASQADCIETDITEPVEENTKVEVRYRTSFMSRLIQSDDLIKEKYSLIKNYLLSFNGVKARTSLNFESFKRGHESCAKLNIKGSYLQLYLALDPDSYESNKYRVSYVGNKPKLETVPTMFKIKTERSMKQAYQLIDECMKKLGIVQGKICRSIRIKSGSKKTFTNFERYEVKMDLRKKKERRNYQ